MDADGTVNVKCSVMSRGIPCYRLDVSREDPEQWTVTVGQEFECAVTLNVSEHMDVVASCEGYETYRSALFPMEPVGLRSCRARDLGNITLHRLLPR